MDVAHAKGAVPRPPFWMKLSVAAGNILQLAGIAAGGLVECAAARVVTAGWLRVILMVAGWLMVYICCHSLAHWIVGRLVGIRFRGYGVRGTDHPEELGAVLRAVLTRLPMFTAISEKESMAKASPIAKALMFAAGETSTIVSVLLTGIYAWRNHLPGGLLWLIIPALMSLDAVFSTTRMPRGDYAKALRALRGE